MRIVYVANHAAGQNDDEGAIAYALQQLGHEVNPVTEWLTPHPPPGADLLLCHHWGRNQTATPPGLRLAKCPKVFWTFDVVEHPDAALEHKTEQRRQWVRGVTEVCDLGFMTDGDWVAKDETGKLTWLMQGADERVIGPGTFRPELACDVLFTGNSRKCGAKRLSFVKEMVKTYGRRFVHVPCGCYRRDLADRIASAKVVVAPDSPVTDRYWSNRVYVALGFGALLLHPACAGLKRHYPPTDVQYYSSRESLHVLIDCYLRGDPERTPANMLRERGLARTLTEHTYRHRVAELLEVVKNRLGVS